MKEIMSSRSIRAPRGLASTLPAPIVELYATLRRDLLTIARDFVGQRSPPFSVRVPLSRHVLDGVVAAREAPLDRGLPAARVHDEERSSSPAQRAAAPLAPSAPQRVTVHLRGAAREVVAAPGQTLLQAGLAAGLRMPFSCGLGGCGTCKLKLVSGRVESEEPNCLSASERAEGYVLACVSRPTEAVVVEITARRRLNATV